MHGNGIPYRVSEVVVGSEQVWTILGFVVGLGVFGFGIVRVLDRKAETRADRMEQRHAEEMKAIRKDHDSIRQEIADKHYSLNLDMQNIHSRVNDVKDHYVKQEVHDRDIANLRDSFTQFRTEIKQDLANGIATFNEGLNAMRRDFTEYLMKLSDRSGDSK